MSRNLTRWKHVAVAVAMAAIPAAATAQPTTAQAQEVLELAKKTQNPVGDVTAVPFQFNFNTGGDLEEQTALNLNFQPAIPFRLTEDWNVLFRSIVPINTVPTSDGMRASGVGDIQAQVYVTPSRPGGLIWGVGPMFSFPTATAAPLETGSWALGPGAVLVKDVGPWVIGGLFQQFWTVADTGGDPDIDLFVLQPFVNYNFGPGWALAFAPLITANWNGDSGNQWTVPLGLGITKTTVFNRRPMSLGVQYYTNATRPDGAAGHQLRFAVSFLFPKPPAP